MLQKSDLEDNIAEYIAERLPHAEIRVLFDIGANVGWFTSQFLRAYPNCECYLFEPVTSNYEAIPSTLNNYPETNPFPRTKCFRVALGLVGNYNLDSAESGTIWQGANATLGLLGETALPTRRSHLAFSRLSRGGFLLPNRLPAQACAFL